MDQRVCVGREIIQILELYIHKIKILLVKLVEIVVVCSEIVKQCDSYKQVEICFNVSIK